MGRDQQHFAAQAVAIGEGAGGLFNYSEDQQFLAAFLQDPYRTWTPAARPAVVDARAVVRAASPGRAPSPASRYRVVPPPWCRSQDDLRARVGLRERGTCWSSAREWPDPHHAPVPCRAARRLRRNRWGQQSRLTAAREELVAAPALGRRHSRWRRREPSRTSPRGGRGDVGESAQSGHYGANTEQNRSALAS